MAHQANPPNQGGCPLISVHEQLAQSRKELQVLQAKIERLTQLQNEQYHQGALADEAIDVQQQNIDASINRLEKKLNDFQKTEVIKIWLVFIAGLIVGFVCCSLFIEIGRFSLPQAARKSFHISPRCQIF